MSAAQARNAVVAGSGAERRPRVSRLGWASLAVMLVLLAMIGREVFLVAVAPAGLAGQHAPEYDRLLAPLRDAEGPDGWAMLRQAIAIKDNAEMAAMTAAGPGGARVDYTVLYDKKSASGDSQVAEVEDVTRKAARQLESSGLTAELDGLCKAVKIVRPSPEGKALEYLLPELGSGRALSRLHVVWAISAARAGNSAERAAILERMLAVARACSSNFTIIDQLVAFAIVNQHCRVFRELLARVPMDEAGLEAALGALDRQPLAPFSFALEGERLSVLDTIDWTHSDEGDGNGHLRPSELRSVLPLMSTPVGSFDPSRLPSMVGNVASLWMATKKQSVQKCEELFRGAKKMAELPRSKRKAVFDEQQFSADLSDRYLLVSVLVPRLGRSLLDRDRVRMELAGTRLMIAIELFRVRHGALPGSLEELTPGILPEIPSDPVSEKAWVYRLIDPAADPHGRGYLLYSVGIDGEDNGGLMPEREQEQIETLTGGRKGFDYVINRPGVALEGAPPGQQQDEGKR